MSVPRPTAPVLLTLALALMSGLVLATPAEAAKWKPKVAAKPAEEAVQPPAAGKAGSTASKADSAKAKTGKTRTAQAHGSSGDSTATELPTGALGFHNATAAGSDKDCFVVKRRTLVPGTGYMIRRSTFCN